MTKQITIRQAFIMILLLTPVMKIDMLPSYIAGMSGRDGWLTMLVPMLVEFSVLGAVILVNMRGGLDTVLTKAIGNWGRRIVMFVLILYFGLQALVYSNEICESISQIWFDQHDWVPVVLPFGLVCAYVGLKTIRGIARSSEIYFWLFIAALFLAVFFNTANTEYSNILPVLSGNAADKLTAGFKASMWYGDYLPFLLLKIKDGDTRKINWLWLAGVLAAVWTMALCVPFYALYRGAASEIPNALSRLMAYVIVSVELGKADWPAIILWLIVAILKVGLALWCVRTSAESMTKRRVGIWVYMAVVIVIYGIIMFFANNIHVGYRIGGAFWIPVAIIQYLVPFFAALISGLRCNGREMVKE